MLLLKNSSLVSISELSKGDYKNDFLRSIFFSFNTKCNYRWKFQSNKGFQLFFHRKSTRMKCLSWSTSFHSQIYRTDELLCHRFNPGFLVCSMLLIYFKAVSCILLYLPKSCFNSREYIVYCSGLNVRFLVFTKLNGFLWDVSLHCIDIT